MDSRLSANSLRRIDEICDDYEQAWCDGLQPRIEDFLLRCELVERPQLLDLLQKLQHELILGRINASAASPAHSNRGELISDRACEPEPRTRGLSSSTGSGPAQHAVPESCERSAPRVVLNVVAGPHKGQQFIYNQHDTLLVGRATQAQLRVSDDMHFSRHHFRLEANPPDCFLLDLGSTNGTFVNGQRVQECYLKDGDVVSGGRTKMVVSISVPDQTSPTSAPSIEVSADGRFQSHQASTGKSVASHPPTRSRLAVSDVRIDGYDIHEKLGTGDLGSVYRATRLDTQETCALKVISPAARADERAVRTFLREASILKQLQHQYIVRIVDLGTSGPELYHSTEYLEVIRWPQLSARWKPEQRIRIACALMSQILAALEHAHARSLVHRDVKPGNILISRQDHKLIAKLADFGLAKCYSTAGMSQMTREGDVIGSLPYMSPEQFINSREARPTCDLYAAAATLYWMITRHEPVQLNNRPCKFLAILEDQPVPVQQHCPEVPDELARIIHRALDKNPENRFASAGEMRTLVSAFKQIPT